jgi:glycerol-3-phosphate O-acyltransferase
MIRRRRVELVGLSDFRRDENVRATLGQLHGTGIVSYHDDGTERLFSIRPEQHHKAAYYRNTAIHHFLVDAIVEMSLLIAADRIQNGALSSQSTRVENENALRDALASDEPVYAPGTVDALMLDTATRLRGVFKFEFYFSRKPAFREEVIVQADRRFADWRLALSQQEQATEKARLLLGQSRLLVAHGVLRAFVDAYRVVSSQLTVSADAAAPARNEFVGQCLKLGKQRLLQAQISSPESVSKTLYETAYKLVEHRGMTAADQRDQRDAFDQFLQQASRSLDVIHQLSTKDR